METILITGAGGFIGRNLLSSPLIDQRAVHALLGPGDQPLSHHVRSSEIDLRVAGGLQGVLAGIETVLHLAGLSSVSASFENPREYLETHILGTHSLLRAAPISSLRRLVYVSSAEVYGQPTANLVKEHAALDPRSPYAAAKAGAEMVIRAASRVRDDISFIILRPFVVYGPGMRCTSVVSSVLQQACSGNRIRIMDSTPIRDFCFIDDVVKALVKAIQLPARPGVQVFNIGTGVGTSISDLAKAAAKAAGRQLPITTLSKRDRPRESDVRRLVADTEAASRVLRWTAMFDLLSGLKATIARRSNLSEVQHV